MKIIALLSILFTALNAWSQNDWLEQNRKAEIYKINLGQNINSPYNEFAPVISANGKTIYFVRNNHPDIIKKWGNENQKIFFSTLDADTIWSEPVDIEQPLNNQQGNFVVSISPDQNTLYLGNRYTKKGEPNGGGLSVSNKVGLNKWSVPKDVLIDNFFNTGDFVSYAISPDQKVLITAIENGQSKGNLDLFVSFKKGENRWSEPVNMGSTINTGEMEFSPFVAADAQTLYFSSKGHAGEGDADIFMSKRLDDTWLNWSTPQNLGPEINTKNWDGYFTIPAAGNVAYLSSANGAIGGSDIFKILLKEEIQPEAVALVSGKVLNSKSGEPVSALIRYKLLATDEEVGTAISNQLDGRYQISLKGGYKYSFMALKEGFYPVSDYLDLKELTSYYEIDKDLSLAPIETGQVIRLNNLFFIFDTDQLIDESLGELNQLLTTLINNPRMKIEIAGHTDSKGSDDYNLNLSERRAKAVVNYLISKGISAKRLTSKGYGETKPIANNDTEEGQQKNRRVEFEVLEK
ncbi:MAG: OmpA family protein [Bacteroidales bacterium]|nr:OmpA family protein [Bacteroidales bacterium]